jgi:hypothetical protein
MASIESFEVVPLPVAGSNVQDCNIYLAEATLQNDDIRGHARLSELSPIRIWKDPEPTLMALPPEMGLGVEIDDEVFATYRVGQASE